MRTRQPTGATRRTRPAGTNGARGGVRPGDDGSAVAEFVMVSALLALVFAAVLQIGLAMHVRNTVVDSAIAGARIAAAADRTEEDGAQHTALLVSTAIGARYAEDIAVTTSPSGPQTLITVTVRTPIPVIGLVGPSGVWELQGRAFAEDPAL